MKRYSYTIIPTKLNNSRDISKLSNFSITKVSEISYYLLGSYLAAYNKFNSIYNVIIVVIRVIP